MNALKEATGIDAESWTLYRNAGNRRVRLGGRFDFTPETLFAVAAILKAYMDGGTTTTTKAPATSLGRVLAALQACATALQRYDPGSAPGSRAFEACKAAWTVLDAHGVKREVAP